MFCTYQIFEPPSSLPSSALRPAQPPTPVAAVRPPPSCPPPEAAHVRSLRAARCASPPTTSHATTAAAKQSVRAASPNERLWLEPHSDEAHAGVVVLSPYLPLHTQRQPWAELGVAAALTHPQRWIFILTNLPYFYVAISVVSTDESLPLAAGAPECALCSSSGLGLIVALLGLVSAYWHGAQCQLLPQIYCYSAERGEAALHTPRWLGRLVLGDIFCSVLVMLVGLVCFGSYRTCSWIFPPFLLFFLGSRCKKAGRYGAYALCHGGWHLLSAAAISQIALNPQGLFG